MPRKDKAAAGIKQTAPPGRAALKNEAPEAAKQTTTKRNRGKNRHPMNTLNEIIEWPISAKAHQGELEERENFEVEDLPAHVRAWTDKKQHRLHFNDFLARSGYAFKGNIIEIGAGSCWLSSLISRQPGVQKIHAVEFSRKRLETWSPVCMEHYNADPSKIIRVHGDFNNLQVPDSSCDAVAADAVLHHAEDLPFLLAEIRRVLKPGGALIAFREPTTASLRKIPAPFVELEYEHIYTRSQYENFLSSAGFTPRAIPGFAGTTLKARIKQAALMPFLNGLLFSHYVYMGIKK